MQENENKNTSTIEFEVKVKTFDMNKGELIDAIASGSKLTKADAGRSLDKSGPRIISHDDVIFLEIEPGEKGALPKVTALSHSKLTKADAGRNLDETK